jgi:hypothetical protein
MTAEEQVVGYGRFSTDTAGYAQMLSYMRAWPERTWAVEGCEGITRHVAQRLVAGQEIVIDVPAKLSARIRVYATGQGARPTRRTHTQSRWSACGSTGCTRSCTTNGWKSSGCRSAGAAASATTTPG